jgi:hypothetical protein
LDLEDRLIPRPYANAIKKAYLSNAQTRAIRPGSTLLFYRSGDVRAVMVVGVVEETLVSQDPAEVAAFVGPRTVYTFEEIDEMTKRPVLSVLFRGDRVVDPPISLDELLSRNALGGAPQSISSIRPGGVEWIRARIQT